MFVKKIVNNKHEVSKHMFELFCVAIDQFTDSVASRRNLVTHSVFSWGLVYCLDTSKILLIYIVFHTFSHTFLFSCIRCSFEQYTRKLSVYLRKLSDNNFLFFLFSFGRCFFWAPISFACYHFQSGYDPG